MFAILKSFSQYCMVIQRSLMFSVMFVSNFCFMVKQFLYIIGLHWGFWRWPLCSTWLGGVVAMDVRCSSVFTASFLVGGVHGL